jgi:hypothetical protein
MPTTTVRPTKAEKIWLGYKEGRGKKRGGRFWKHHDETPIRMIGVWDTVGNWACRYSTACAWSTGTNFAS